MVSVKIHGEYHGGSSVGGGAEVLGRYPGPY